MFQAEDGQNLAVVHTAALEPLDIAIFRGTLQREDRITAGQVHIAEGLAASNLPGYLPLKVIYAADAGLLNHRALAADVKHRARACAQCTLQTETGIERPRHRPASLIVFEVAD